MVTVQELDKITKELWKTAKNTFSLGEEERYVFAIGVTLALLHINEGKKEDTKNDTNSKPIGYITSK